MWEILVWIYIKSSWAILIPKRTGITIFGTAVTQISTTTASSPSTCWARLDTCGSAAQRKKFWSAGVWWWLRCYYLSVQRRGDSTLCYGSANITLGFFSPTSNHASAEKWYCNLSLWETPLWREREIAQCGSPSPSLWSHPRRDFVLFPSTGSAWSAPSCRR